MISDESRTHAIVVVVDGAAASTTCVCVVKYNLFKTLTGRSLNVVVQVAFRFNIVSRLVGRSIGSFSTGQRSQ